MADDGSLRKTFGFWHSPCPLTQRGPQLAPVGWKMKLNEEKLKPFALDLIEDTHPPPELFTAAATPFQWD